MWLRDDVWTRSLILSVAIASSFFVVLPYCANLFVAARIRSLGGVIRCNEAASTWFEHRSKLFTFLVVLTYLGSLRSARD